MIKLTEFEIFLKQFKTILYRRKERIVLPGQETNDSYYISQGYVMQNIVSPNGNEFTPYIFAPQTFFPLTRSKTGQSMNGDDYEYTSLTPVEIYKFPKEKLMQFLAKDPNAVFAINEQLMAYSAELLKKLQTRIFSNAIHMVVLGLLDLAKLFGKREDKQILIDYWFTHQDIANISGLSREVVTRQMNNLVKKKLIAYKNHFIVINDLEALNMELQA